MSLNALRTLFTPSSSVLLFHRLELFDTAIHDYTNKSYIQPLLEHNCPIRSCISRVLNDNLPRMPQRLSHQQPRDRTRALHRSMSSLRLT